ncbi:MAG: hypothetical protein DRP45_01100 [Candidatus Zixiibacteriota bacterium]|nr:MAG: hypothetical protein DRP45_01100 [candidate division Zixibacteria bacterium]
MILAEGAIFGTYRIEKSIGSGAMGEVYRAVDSRLDRVVALKLIRKELADSTDYRRRLADEAKSAAKIDSPHVVRVWEYSICDGIPYIAMEFVGGRDLTEAATEFDLPEKLGIALQTAEGIHAAHSVDLVHRDLKPDNIHLTDDHEVKILDFGLAKPIRKESIDEQGNIAGTLHYLAPEQLAGEPVTTSSDQFSFGVLLYELLSAQRPFEGDYPAAVIYSILHEDPVPLGELNENVPDWLDSLVLKLLAKQPNDRFPDMTGVIEQLQTSLGGEKPSPVSVATTRRKSVTVIDLRNLSQDSSWDYFCEGFTDDVVSELSRRTDLVVSAQPSVNLPRDIREVFQRFRSDFIVSGSLMRWKDKIKLNLFVHCENGQRLVSSQKYEEPEDRLFELLSQAAQDTSTALADATGQAPVEVDDFLKPDITAYDFYLKGKSYYHCAKPEDLEFATQMYEKSLEIDPDFALAHSGLADIFACQYNFYYDRTEERIEAAKSQALRAIKIAPDLPEGQRSLGRYYQFMGDMAKCEECYLKAIELNPKYALAYRSLAWQKYQEADYSSSLEWATKSLRMAPTDTETLLLIGLLHTYRHRYTAAMATLQRAIEISPDYGRAYYNLGLVYMKLGVLDIALENFDYAAKYQGDPNCYIDAGFVHLIRGEYEISIVAFNKSIQAEFFPFVAYVYLGLLEQLRGDLEQSQKYYRKALTDMKDVDFSNPENVQVQGYWALAQAGTRETETARATLEEITSRDNLIGDVWYNVARAYALMGDEDALRESLKHALAGTPGPTEKEILIDPHFSNLDIEQLLNLAKTA